METGKRNRKKRALLFRAGFESLSQQNGGKKERGVYSLLFPAGFESLSQQDGIGSRPTDMEAKGLISMLFKLNLQDTAFGTAGESACAFAVGGEELFLFLVPEQGNGGIAMKIRISGNTNPWKCRE